MALEQAESARKIATDMLTRLTLHPSRLGNQVPRFHQADRQPHGNERLGAFFAGLKSGERVDDASEFFSLPPLGIRK